MAKKNGKAKISKSQTSKKKKQKKIPSVVKDREAKPFDPQRVKQKVESEKKTRDLIAKANRTLKSFDKNAKPDNPTADEFATDLGLAQGHRDTSKPPKSSGLGEKLGKRLERESKRREARQRFEDFRRGKPFLQDPKQSQGGGPTEDLRKSSKLDSFVKGAGEKFTQAKGFVKKVAQKTGFFPAEGQSGKAFAGQALKGFGEGFRAGFELGGPGATGGVANLANIAAGVVGAEAGFKGREAERIAKEERALKERKVAAEEGKLAREKSAREFDESAKVSELHRKIREKFSPAKQGEEGARPASPDEKQALGSDYVKQLVKPPSAIDKLVAEMQKQRTDEQARANRASEEARNRGLSETERANKANEAEKAAKRVQDLEKKLLDLENKKDEAVQAERRHQEQIQLQRDALSQTALDRAERRIQQGNENAERSRLREESLELKRLAISNKKEQDEFIRAQTEHQKKQDVERELTRQYDIADRSLRQHEDDMRAEARSEGGFSASSRQRRMELQNKAAVLNRTQPLRLYLPAHGQKLLFFGGEKMFDEDIRDSGDFPQNINLFEIDKKKYDELKKAENFLQTVEKNGSIPAVEYWQRHKILLRDFIKTLTTKTRVKKKGK